MKRVMVLSTGAFMAALLVAAPTVAQTPQPQPPGRADCKAPPKIDGQVTKVDPGTNKVTVRASDGQTHEFQVAKETLSTLKPGDRLEANLRQAPNC